jgi:hypothetical protein
MKQLCILVVKDSEGDTALLPHELRRGGYASASSMPGSALSIV